jgi:hypothetical protein
MHRSEPRAVGSRRLLWISAALAIALWLFLVNANAAFAGGDHSSNEWGSPGEDSNSWSHDSEGTPGSWGHPPDQGPPPEGSGEEQPCEHPGTPPEETPPVTPPETTPPPENTPPETTPPPETKPPETPPETTPPPETKPPETPPETTPPPETKPPETTPPPETPPETTPPGTTPPEYTPPETPPDTPTDTPTPKPHKPSSPQSPENTGGVVLPQEQGQGNGGEVAATTATGAESTLPFTGADIRLLLLTGAAFLGLGLVLHRMTTQRG